MTTSQLSRKMSKPLPHTNQHDVWRVQDVWLNANEYALSPNSDLINRTLIVIPNRNRKQ